MKYSKLPLVFVVACAFIASLTLVHSANAIDRFWQGDVSGVYGGSTGSGANAGNWNSLTAGTSPAGSNNERAVIGTDSPSGELNSNNAPFGSPMLSGGAAVAGGIALGLRVIDYFDEDFDGMTNDFLYEPAPIPGTLIGALTLAPGANLQTQTTPDSGIGANGNVLVGVHGRGYLTMTGGSLKLNDAALIVSGQNITTDAGTPQELGPSLVDLSGSSSLTTTGGGGIMNLDRRLRITGPSVTLNAAGRIRFTGDSSYTAVITDASSHSSIHSDNNILLSGALTVEFSGAAATRDPITSLGTTWTLADSSLSSNAIDGNFNNLGQGGVINVTGLDEAHAPPLGANYRVRKVAVGGSSELQLSYEETLVLTVNRDTGELSIRNPLGGNIAIDAYSVSSARGSLLPDYDGLGSSTSGAGVWITPPSSEPSGESPYGSNTVKALSEVREPDPSPPHAGDDGAYDLSAVSSVSLGTGFDRMGVGADVSNFGFDGEDLIFEFTGPSTDGTVLRGQVEYIGTKYENDLVLRVNPNNGQAFLLNESLETLTFDGYSILSSTGDLNGTGFTGLSGTWETTTPTSDSALTQTNLLGATTLEPDDEVAIGNITNSAALSEAAQDGLSLQFILTESLEPGGPPGGDYNEDGTVDAADYTVFRDNLNAMVTLPNENPDAMTPGLVNQEDYDYWVAQFGATAGPESELTFRTGSVVFDATAGSGSLAAGAVPEPSACLLMLFGLSAYGFVRRPTKRKTHLPPIRRAGDGSTFQVNGEATMPNKNWMLAMAVAGIFAAMLASAPAAAETKGIPLTNGDFELPGPVGTKVVAFGEDGTPFAPTDPVVTLTSGQQAGGIPGWTFTGGSGDPASGETNAGKGNSLFGDELPGDSGTEGGGTIGNELLLSTLDGRVFQTSTFTIESIPTTQKYQFAFDVHHVFTPIGVPQFTARLYYVDAGSNRVTIGSPMVVDGLGAFERMAFEFHGDNPTEMALLTPAMNRPVGIEFDTTSFETDDTPDHLESWAGVDNVIMQITGIKRGDFDGDGDVDMDDYDTLRGNLQGAHTYESEGELTGDYFVDLNDFRAFKTLYEADQGAGSFGTQLASVPEPSSFVLLAVMAAALLGTVRWRNSHRLVRLPAWLPAVVAIGALLVASADSRATQFAYDPFLIGANPAAGEYTVTTYTTDDPPVAIDPLEGQNPTIGPASPSFFRDGWTLGSAGQVVIDTGLTYLGMPSPGGSVNGFGRTERYLNNTGNPMADWDGDTEGTYYMSMLANFGVIAEGGNMGYRAVEFFPVGVVPGENRIGEIGYNEYDGSLGPAEQNAATAKMWFNLYGSHIIIDAAPDNYNEDGLTHLLVLKWVFSTEDASDSISLFFDPKSVDEPVVPSAVVTGVNATLGSIGSASFGSAIAGTTTTLDDIRVGDTFIDVLPELPLPGDVNGDDMVDLLDYQIIISHMNLTGVPLSSGDVTGDGRVTIADYRFWKDRRTDLAPEGGSAGALAGVPEPSSLALIVAAALVGCVRRRVR